MSVTVKRGTETLFEGELPEVELIKGEWFVRGSVIQDGSVKELADGIANLAAVITAKRKQEEKLVKVGRYLAGYAPGFGASRWSDDPKSYGYTYWTGQAQRVIDLIEGLE